MEIIRVVVPGIFLILEGVRDLKKRKISMTSVFLTGILGILFGIPLIKDNFISMLGGIAIGLVCLLIAGLTNEKVGYGDGWVLTVMGIYLGFRSNLYLLSVSLFLASLTSVLLLISKKAGRKTELPFVTFMIPGYFLLIAIR